MRLLASASVLGTGSDGSTRTRELGGVDPALVGLVAAGTATLVHHAVLHQWLPRRFHVPANIGAAVLLTAAARAAGADWAELGLDRCDLSSGAVFGLAAAVPVAVAVGAVAALPAGQRLLVHDRAGSANGRDLAYELAVRIPIGTAGAEEVLFRGALLGLLLRRHSLETAVAWSSVLFGLWHIPPTVRDTRDHATVGPVLASSRLRQAAALAVVVSVTAAAGVGFAALRIRSRSVLAPAIVHAALNATAFVVGRWAAAKLLVEAGA